MPEDELEPIEDELLAEDELVEQPLLVFDMDTGELVADR